MNLRRWILASELVSDLSQQGVTLWAEAERLRFRAPEGTLTDIQRAMLADYKAEVLDLLNKRVSPNEVGTVRSFVFNGFRAKCYICHSQGEAVIVDPGCASPEEQRLVINYLETHQLKLRHLLLTHAHYDHFYGGAFLAAHYQMGLRMHEADLSLLHQGGSQAGRRDVVEEPPLGRYLEDGETLTFGDITWRVLHTPGHSPGSVCFHDAVNQFVVSGDVLFRSAVGSILMPGGSSLVQLLESIQSRLMTLPDETLVYPGHGPPTAIGTERTSNPWLPSECCELKD